MTPKKKPVPIVDVDYITVDSHRRITLPKAIPVTPGSSLVIEVLKTGHILLIPSDLVKKHKIESGEVVQDGKKCLLLYGNEL